MAVYEHNYRPFAGSLTPDWSRFLIIPRHAYRSVFQSKLFTAFFVICLVYPLIATILIYLHHNTQALGMFKASVKELIPIDASFFQVYLFVQGQFAFYLNLLVGPPLISRDMSNNALPLYLARPFSQSEYVMGKMSVLLILLSFITWIPGLLLFLFQAYLEGAGWFASNLYIAAAIFIGSWIWIILLALLSLSISAWVKWRLAASAALFGLFFIPAIFGQVINGLFMTRIGNLFNLSNLIYSVWGGLMGTFTRNAGQIRGRINGRYVNVTLLEPPLWSSWLMLSLICVACLLLLYRKVRAYEVVR
jgi:ABC-type transport system involved in multi-copper enzyme maturation permease subunit